MNLPSAGPAGAPPAWTRSCSAADQTRPDRRGPASRTPSVVVVSYGITSRVAQRAIEMARGQGLKAGRLRLIAVWPFPEQRIRELAEVKAFVVPELNLGQMVREVERVRAAARRTIPVAHAGGGVHDPRGRSWRPSWRRRDERNAMDARQPGRRHSCARTACRTSGARAAASAPRSTASPGRWSIPRLDLEQGRGGLGHRLHRAASPATSSWIRSTPRTAAPSPSPPGLKLANPDSKVVVYSGDGDLSAIGGNHLIHAARRNVDIKVICVNNLIYAMTGGQTAPTTPTTSITSTAPYGTFEPAFNLPQLVESAGAVYVARWTTFHVRQLERSMTEVLQKKGFSLHRSALALPDALPAPQQDGRRPGRHEVLQAGEQDSQRRAHQRNRRSPSRARSSSASSSTATGPITSNC